jgi:hypothetical protein
VVALNGSVGFDFALSIALIVLLLSGRPQPCFRTGIGVNLGSLSIGRLSPLYITLSLLISSSVRTNSPPEMLINGTICEAIVVTRS